jgi:uncharacterized protein with PIN domain
MSFAYIDSSAVVAMAFHEPDAFVLTEKLATMKNLVSSNLLEAETRAVCARENIEFPEPLLSEIGWILPERPLARELKMVLDAGYLRGADLWHVASALYAFREPYQNFFITLDGRQEAVARAIGFQVLTGNLS